jgi:hypothetical protein
MMNEPVEDHQVSTMKEVVVEQMEEEGGGMRRIEHPRIEEKTREEQTETSLRIKILRGKWRILMHPDGKTMYLKKTGAIVIGPQFDVPPLDQQQHQFQANEEEEEEGTTINQRGKARKPGVRRSNRLQERRMTRMKMKP